MKRSIITMLLLASLSAEAQTSPAGITPSVAFSAFSTVLNIGGWIFKGGEKVYYVQVEAIGPNEDAARQSAYSKAVELAVGAVVFTGRETINDQQTRNEIIVHSSGYVEDYKIVSKTQNNGMTNIVVDVWVSDAKMAKRLTTYGFSEGALVNGQQIQDNWNRDQAIKRSDEQRRKTGRELVLSVLRDLPKMGYTSRVTGTRVANYSGSLGFGITIDTGFKKEYISDLAKVMKETSGPMSFWTVNPNEKRFIINHQGLGSGWTRTNSYYQDYVQAFEQDKYMIIKFYDNTGLNYTNCWQFTQQDDRGYWQLAGFSPDMAPQNTGMGFVNENYYTIYEGDTVSTTYVQPRNNLSEEQFIRWASKINRVEAYISTGDDPLAKNCKKTTNNVRM